MTTTPTQTAGTILHGLLSQYGADLEASGTGILSTALASLVKTPTVQNAVAQGLAISVAAPLVLPTLEGEAIGQFAAAGQALLALLPAPAAS